MTQMFISLSETQTACFSNFYSAVLSSYMLEDSNFNASKCSMISITSKSPNMNAGIAENFTAPRDDNKTHNETTLRTIH